MNLPKALTRQYEKLDIFLMIFLRDSENYVSDNDASTTRTKAVVVVPWHFLHSSLSSRGDTHETLNKIASNSIFYGWGFKNSN